MLPTGHSIVISVRVFAHTAASSRNFHQPCRFHPRSLDASVPGFSYPGWPVYVLVSLCPADGEQWVLNDFACRREFAVSGRVASSAEIGNVHFLPLGKAKQDGSDIRVVAGRDELPYRILDSRVDEFFLAVGLRPGIRTFQVYYGNPEAERPRPPMRITRGLVLETRVYRGGRFRTWNQMQATVARSGPRIGRGFVPTVFHAFNPFGPSDRYVSIYEEWLKPPVQGLYLFATSSDDASFLFVNGQLAAKQVRGRARRDARNAGQPILLKSDRFYHFKYVHVEVNGFQAAVAAWRPPNARFRVIPASAFPGVHSCRHMAYMVKGDPIAPDISVTNEGNVLFQGNVYYRYQFHDVTGGDALTYEPFWDFGDGNVSHDRNPEHVYLENKSYTVTLALRKGTREYRASQRIVVQENWANQAKASTDRIWHYYRILKNYNFRAMSTLAVERAYAILKELNKPVERLEAAHALLLRDEIMNHQGKVYYYGLDYGRLLCKLKAETKEALDTFRFVDEQINDKAKKARVLCEIGDVYLFYEGKYTQALKQYETVLKTYSGLDDDVLRQAKIRVGEAYMHLGNREKAYAAFETAEKDSPIRHLCDRKHIIIGAAPVRVENYLRRREFDEAEKELNWWEWEYPTERLKGDSTLWRVRLAQARGQHEEAIKQVILLLHVNPQCRNAVDLLLEAAESYEALNDTDNAVKILERILKEYPETSYQGEVNQRIKRLGQGTKKTTSP